jgi:serine/threonine-protein kinase HipA
MVKSTDHRLSPESHAGQASGIQDVAHRACGSIESGERLLDACGYFSPTRVQALAILGEVLDALDAVSNGKQVARSADIGLSAEDLDGFEDAFEHGQTAQARKLLGHPKALA